jgi:superfamily II DNA or RNA helicase
MILRPIQRRALDAAASAQGLFAHIGVGHGKTLICGLLPIVLGARNPLLLVPASMMKATHKLRAEYDVPPCTVWSHERLSHPAHYDDLAALSPDCIIIDEAHAFRGASARRRRLGRYISEHRPRVAVLSGTLLRPRISGACELAQ